MTRVSEHPRVLVVGAEPFGRSSGTGITLSNLFDGWPRDRLAQVYTTRTEPSSNVCEQYFAVDPWNAPVDHVVRSVLTRGRTATAGSAAAAAAVPAGGNGSWKGQARRSMRAVADLSPLLVPADLRAWARRFHPDVVYSVLGSVRVIRLARRLAGTCGVPIVPHFMDDWPATLYSNGELFGLGRRAVDAGLGGVVRRATSGLCISAPMAEEYQRRYGIPFAPFMNCVQESAFDDRREAPPAVAGAGPVEFVYVGGLHLDRWASLARLGAALERLASPPGPARLTLYAPESDLARYGAAFAHLPAVRLARSIGSAEVAPVLWAADVLVHVESFKPEIAQYTRLSLSTKLPQYLAAGRPILGHGPGDLASMRHIVTTRAGLVVGEEDLELLIRRAGELCGDPLLRRRLGDRGYVYAKAHHAKKEVAARFAEHLARVAGRAEASR
ncbi:glycosyl transferase family 1 [Micromonospora zamorensis]|uniref:glycosyl transferase family 1 n=1 Tax=Micromonospora zamorensis TaxID=709883 RepID=UPI002E17B586|nr:glycosyl transferase family 1 [Micromonospora zamorensis]WTE89609.1 glycosyl transferase family 1 [Micromonospora zamorensis]